MVAFTTAKGLYQVANSSYIGTWDVPENSNWGVVDAALGQITTIQLNNTPVTLTGPQTQCCQIIFSSSAAPGGVLSGNVGVTFPTVIPSSTPLTGPYIIQNLCGNSSQFVVTLQTTVAGGQNISCKPGEPFDVVNDGVNIKYKNLGHIGTYLDYASSAVPVWVTNCTIPPYLNCDGTSFSSATYPILASIIGTVLPDSRGRLRAAYNQGTGLITAGGSGLNGNNVFATGGSEFLQQHNHLTNDPGHGHGAGYTLLVPNNAGFGGANLVVGGGSYFVNNNSPVQTNVTGITIVNNGSGTFQNIQPTLIHGITMIRAG